MTCINHFYIGIEKFLSNIDESNLNSKGFICMFCLEMEPGSLRRQKIYKHGRKVNMDKSNVLTDEGKVQSTKKYHLFSFLEGNRAIDQRHVHNLADAILEKNLLHINPIAINSDFEIIDGQHRFCAAKELEVPIFYIVDDHLKLDDVKTINTNMKNWTHNDYINSHISQGHKDFILV
jgi:hypothetical protein